MHLEKNLYFYPFFGKNILGISFFKFFLLFNYNSIGNKSKTYWIYFWKIICHKMLYLQDIPKYHKTTIYTVVHQRKKRGIKFFYFFLLQILSFVGTYKGGCLFTSWYAYKRSTKWSITNVSFPFCKMKTDH